jgi:hypothetical protein
VEFVGGGEDDEWAEDASSIDADQLAARKQTHVQRHDALDAIVARLAAPQE